MYFSITINAYICKQTTIENAKSSVCSNIYTRAFSHALVWGEEKGVCNRRVAMQRRRVAQEDERRTENRHLFLRQCETCIRLGQRQRRGTSKTNRQFRKTPRIVLTNHKTNDNIY